MHPLEPYIILNIFKICVVYDAVLAAHHLLKYVNMTLTCLVIQPWFLWDIEWGMEIVLEWIFLEIDAIVFSLS